MEQIRRIMRPTEVPDTGKEIHLFSIGELAFKDGLPMEDIISENRSCPMVDYTEGKITETSILITCNTVSL